MLKNKTYNSDCEEHFLYLQPISRTSELQERQ